MWEPRWISRESDKLDGPGSILHSAHADSRAHRVSWPMRTGGSSLELKWQRRQADYSPSSSAEVKNGEAISPCPHIVSRHSAYLSTGKTLLLQVYIWRRQAQLLMCSATNCPNTHTAHPTAFRTLRWTRNFPTFTESHGSSPPSWEPATGLHSLIDQQTRTLHSLRYRSFSGVSDDL
jgi:hypothetical protein